MFIDQAAKQNPAAGNRPRPTVWTETNPENLGNLENPAHILLILSILLQILLILLRITPTNRDESSYLSPEKMLGTCEPYVHAAESTHAPSLSHRTR